MCVLFVVANMKNSVSDTMWVCVFSRVSVDARSVLRALDENPLEASVF